MMKSSRHVRIKVELPVFSSGSGGSCLYQKISE